MKVSKAAVFILPLHPLLVHIYHVVENVCKYYKIKIGKVIPLQARCDRSTRRGWVVSSMFRPHFTPGKDSVPIVQEAGWALGPVWMGGKSCPHRDLIPVRPARSQSLYRLSYLAHKYKKILFWNTGYRRTDCGVWRRCGVPCTEW